jgi:hypothetical protein
MDKIVMIFNGVDIDYRIAEKAFQQAKNSQGSVQAVFLLAAHDKESNYAFPNDLDAAESLTGEPEAEQADNAIIQDFISMLNKDAKNAGVELASTVLKNPSAAELEQLLKEVTLVYVKQLPADKREIPVDGINFTAMVEALRLPIEFV